MLFMLMIIKSTCFHSVDGVHVHTNFKWDCHSFTSVSIKEIIIIKGNVWATSYLVVSSNFNTPLLVYWAGFFSSFHKININFKCNENKNKNKNTCVEIRLDQLISFLSVYLSLYVLALELFCCFISEVDGFMQKYSNWIIYIWVAS